MLEKVGDMNNIFKVNFDIEVKGDFTYEGIHIKYEVVRGSFKQALERLLVKLDTVYNTLVCKCPVLLFNIRKVIVDTMVRVRDCIECCYNNETEQFFADFNYGNESSTVSVYRMAAI